MERFRKHRLWVNAGLRVLFAVVVGLMLFACGKGDGSQELVAEASALFEAGDLEKAQLKALQAEEMLDSGSGLRERNELNRLLANIYYLQNNRAKAVEYNKKALDYSERMNDTASIATDLYNLGLSLDSIDEAAEYFRKAVDMAAAAGYKQIESTALDKLAKALIIKGDFQQAESCLDTAYSVSSGNSIRLVEIAMSRCALALYSGDYDAALRGYEAMPDSSLNIYGRFEKYSVITNLLAKKGDFAKAYIYKDSVAICADSIHSLDGRSRSDEIQKQHQADIERRQLKFHILLWVSIGVFIFMLAILIVVLKNFRLKRSQLVLTDKIASLNARIAELMPRPTEEQGAEQISADDIVCITALIRRKFELSAEIFKRLPQYSMLKKLNLIKDFTPEHRSEVKDVYDAIVGRFSDCCSDVRQAFAGMTGDDAVYCAMSFIGCRKEVVSLALGSSEEALRRRKSRIKQKLPLPLFLFFFSK